MAVKANLNISQGATFTARIAVTDAAGLALNLSGYTTRGHARGYFGATGLLMDLDPDVVSGESPDYLALPSGLVDINLTAVQTAALPIHQAVYDVEMYNDAGTVTRILEGKVNIAPEVTS